VSTTVKNLKQVTLWADMMPVRTVVFLVYSNDSWYSDIFCDTLKRTIEESFVGKIAVINPHYYVQSMLDELFLFDDNALLIKIINAIREKSQEGLLYKELTTLFAEEVFPYEFIIVDGWKFISEINCIEENFDIDDIIKIKLDSSKDSEELSDLYDYRYFDFTFDEFNLDKGGFPPNFHTDMNVMLDKIFTGE